MLKMEHSIDYFKKGKSRSEILEGAQRVKQPNLQASSQQPSTQHKRTKTDSKDKSEDALEDSNAKRTRTSSPDHQHVEVDVEPGSGLSSRKRQKLSASSYAQRSSDVENPEILDRKPRGLLKSYHGIAYQVQWMMVVALEAQQRLRICGLKESEKRSAFMFKTIDFKTEDSESGKFDDLVWRYETSQPESYEWNFLQAKHKLKTEEKITLGDLLKPKQREGSSRSNKKDKRPFALEQYFLSYRDEIKKKYNGKINKLIIATNIDFDNDLSSSDLFEQDNIPVLDFMEEGTNEKRKKCWRIKKGDSFLKNEVIKQLESTYDSIKLDEIEEFFERLTFVVSYPQKMLDEFIKKKCSWFVGIEDDCIAYEFQAKIANALNLERKEFISTARDVAQFFDNAEQQINRLTLIYPTLEYRAKIEEFGITFNEEPSGLNYFLDSQNRNSSTKKVFNLVNPHKTILSSIKVYQTLKDSLEYQKDGSHIFVRLSSLLRIKDRVIKAFESTTSYNLLVIECKAAEENAESNMVQKLLNVTRSSDKKKIILITLENDPLAGKFKEMEEKIYEKAIDERNGLTDLTVESQKELLKNKQVTFQGEEVSLDKLIDQESKHIIDAETLSKLINNKKIEIGIKRPDLSDLESIYYVTSVEMEEGSFQHALESNLDDVFVISRTTKSEFEKEFPQLLSKIDSHQKKAICSLQQNIPSIEENKFIILTDKDEEKNLADFKQICSLYHKKMVANDLKKMFAIHLIEKNNNNKLVWKRSYDPSFYIPRELYYVTIEKNSLKKYVAKEPEKTRKKKDIFAVSGIDKKELKNVYEIDAFEEENLSTDDTSSKKNHVMLLEDTEESFEKLCSKDKIKDFYNIHWLQNKRDKESNHLVWKRTEGEINKIRGLESENSEFLIDKDDLNTIINTEKAIVIADEPGMGKSTTLTQLLSQPPKSDWVIKLDLINLQKQLEDLAKDVISTERIKDFFSKVDAGLKEGLAKNLLEHRLVEGGVTLLFDGFDEISYENQEKFIELLEFLRDTKAKIQVTTRLYAKDRLEDTLSVLPYTFQPFLKRNQEEFLRTFWNASLKMVPDKDKFGDAVCKGIKNIFKPFYKNINDNVKYKLMSTPLLIRMFAEVYQKTIEHFCSHKNQVKTESFWEEVNKLSILDLYKRFIEKKYDIYFKEKMKMEVNPGYVKDKVTKALDKDHQRLAFNTLFPSYSEQLVDKHKLLSQVQEKDLKLVGVIQSINNEDSHYFIHKTFAEYFSAGLLADIVGRQENNPKRQIACKFLCEHIFKQESRIMRNFFDHMLAKDNIDETRYEIHNAVLNNDKDKVQELLEKENIINSLDKGGRTVLHLAAAYGYEETVQVLLEHGAGVEIVVDNIFGWKSLNYAQEAGEWDVAKKILEKAKFFGVNLNKELVKEFRMLPRKIAEGLCEIGKYEGTYRFNEKALESLRTVLGEKHLEVAIMFRYVGNALGDQHRYSEKKENLQMALEVLKEHCEVAKGEKNPELQENYFQQALSSFKEGFESVKGQGADKEKETWKRLLDIEIAKVNRNLGNVYGELAEKTRNMKEKEKLFEEKKKLLEEALDIFKKYELKIYIAKTKRNLGNVYGELAEVTEDEKLFEKKKKLLEEALVIFEESLRVDEKQDANLQAYSYFEDDQVKVQDDGSLDEVWERVLKIDVAKTKRNLGNVYGELAEKTRNKEEKKKLFEEKKKLLKDALDIFKRYELKIYIARTKRNLGNVYGELAEVTEDVKEKKKLFERKKKLLEEALDIFKESLRVAEKQNANLQNKRSFEDDQVKVQDDGSLDEEWERELKIDIAKTKRNLGNVYVKLAEVTGDVKKFLEKGIMYLEEALNIFKQYNLDDLIDKAKRNLSKARKLKSLEKKEVA